MTKLNYINRKSEGVKLGQIVAKDLRKRIKQSTPPKGESHKDSSPIELHLDGKNLTDDGLAEVARGLEEALQASAETQNTKLRVLNLSRNGLTARALAELALSIQAASADLEELDLAGNCICVTNDTDLRHWQTFLLSLRHVRRLTLLNLCGNDISGIAAWDIFARIYAQDFHGNEATLEHLADEIHDPVVNEFSLPERLHALDLHSSNGSLESQKSNALNSSSTHGLRGLPSISTIRISDVGLTDSGALFLSYPLAQHRWIQEYILGNQGQNHQGHLPTKQGIIYHPNDAMTAVGVKLLKLAETVAYEPPAAIPPVPENSPMSRNGSVDVGAVRRASLAVSHFRKTSTGSSSTDAANKASIGLHHHTDADDLDSLRKKMQRTILEDKGSCSIELWAGALRLLVHARQILVQPVNSSFLSSQATSPTPAESSPVRTPSSPTMDPRSRRSSSTAQSSSPCTTQPSYASRLVVNAEQGGHALSVAAVPNMPETPHIFRHPRHRRHSFSYHSTSTSPSNKVAGEARAVVKAAIRMTHDDPRLIGPLPAKAWTVVITELADPNGVLSSRQVQSVINWARDRGTLIFEMEALGKPDSVQIWRVLEGMGCLAYDGRV